MLVNLKIGVDQLFELKGPRIRLGGSSSRLCLTNQFGSGWRLLLAAAFDARPLTYAATNFGMRIRL